MLSDEEKKTIEYFKRKITNKKTAYTSIYFKIKKLDTLIDIIEKQSKEIEELQELSISVRAVNQIDKLQKEIEELKEKNKILETISLSFNEIQDRDKKWKNKIKTKIEEVSDGTYDAKIVLQSLLKEE